MLSTFSEAHGGRRQACTLHPSAHSFCMCPTFRGADSAVTGPMVQVSRWRQADQEGRMSGSLKDHPPSPAPLGEATPCGAALPGTSQIQGPGSTARLGGGAGRPCVQTPLPGSLDREVSSSGPGSRSDRKGGASTCCRCGPGHHQVSSLPGPGRGGVPPWRHQGIVRAGGTPELVTGARHPARSIPWLVGPRPTRATSRHS